MARLFDAQGIISASAPGPCSSHPSHRGRPVSRIRAQSLFVVALPVCFVFTTRRRSMGCRFAFRLPRTAGNRCTVLYCTVPYSAALQTTSLCVHSPNLRCWVQYGVDSSLHAVRCDTTEGAIEPVIPQAISGQALALAGLRCHVCVLGKATPNKQRVGNEETDLDISAS